MALSKPLPARASLLWVEGQDQSPRQALTVQQGSGATYTDWFLKLFYLVFFF